SSVAPTEKGDRKRPKKVSGTFVSETKVPAETKVPDTFYLPVAEFCAHYHHERNHQVLARPKKVSGTFVSETKVPAETKVPDTFYLPVAEFCAHYHHERNHQGLANRLIDPD